MSLRIILKEKLSLDMVKYEFENNPERKVEFRHG
jgi:hypothetical protein